MKNRLVPALVLSLSLAGCGTGEFATLQVVMGKGFDRFYPFSLGMVSP